MPLVHIQIIRSIVYVPYDSNSEGIDTDIPYRGKGTRPYTTTLDREVTQ